MEKARANLEKAIERLEKTIGEKIVPAANSAEPNKELLTLRKEIKELRETNKIASNRLDKTIGQIKKILGN